MVFRKKTSLREAMKGSIKDSLLPIVPKRFDYVGDIAVISIPAELNAYKKAIAAKLFSMRGNTQAVLNKVSKLEGEYRTADFELLLGESTKTLHRENGYTYKMDVKKVFFNPRLYSERKRVALKVIQGEHILIPFAGIGPFVFPAAGKGAKVYAVEINPEACACLKENLRINRLEDKVIVFQADFATFSRIFTSRNLCLNKGSELEKLTSSPENPISFADFTADFSADRPSSSAPLDYSLSEDLQIPEKGFDRAIVPTPYGMDHFLSEVSTFVKKGGNIHFYTFKAESQIPDLIKEYNKMGLEVEFYKRCGNVAPRISRWVFDLVKNYKKPDKKIRNKK